MYGCIVSSCFLGNLIEWPKSYVAKNLLPLDSHASSRDNIDSSTDTAACWKLQCCTRGLQLNQEDGEGA